MSNKTFCPILTIGFDPPEKGKRDNRLCMRDCAWYDPSEEKCYIEIIAEHIQMVELHSSDMSDYLGDIAEKKEEDYETYSYPSGFDEDPWEDGYRPRKRT